MDTVTTASAGAALTVPLWIQTVTPYAQFVIMIMGGIFLGLQIYNQIKKTGQ